LGALKHSTRCNKKTVRTSPYTKVGFHICLMKIKLLVSLLAGLAIALAGVPAAQAQTRLTELDPNTAQTMYGILIGLQGSVRTVSDSLAADQVYLNSTARIRLINLTNRVQAIRNRDLTVPSERAAAISELGAVQMELAEVGRRVAEIQTRERRDASVLGTLANVLRNLAAILPL